MSIKVEEMRRGLFRVTWTMKSLGHDDVTLQKGVFHLSNSPSCSTFIVYSRSRKPSLIDYADVCIMLKRKTNKSGDDPQQSSAAAETKMPVIKSNPSMLLQEQYEKPLFVWVENEVLGKKLMLHLEEAWQIFVPITNYNEPKIILWMDFGTNSVGQTRMIKDFADLFLNQTNCDVHFRLQGVVMGAHVVILTARSSVFAAMFQCDMEESKTKKVVIEDIEPEVFRQLLHYLYTGTCPFLEMKSITRDLYVAADKYDIETLKKECVDILLAQLEMKNSIAMLVWSHLHSIPTLFDASLKCIAINGPTICFMPDWKDLTHDYPDLCLMATQHMMKMKVYGTSCEDDCETDDCETDIWETEVQNIFPTTSETDCETDSDWLELPEQIRRIASLIKL
jgi:speckle-type POZ protein